MATDLTKATDYGVKIALPGFDVKTAGDYQLLFNSAWPSIAVGYVTSITIAAGGSQTVTHNLGFPPFIRVYQVVSGSGTATTISDGAGPSGASFKFDATTVTVMNNGTTSCIYQVVCYNLDLTKSVRYKLLKPPATKLPYIKNYGLKIAKNGKSAKSTDLRDYAVHTRAQSPAVLSVLTQDDKSGTDITYSNQQNYTAWTFGFCQVSPNNYWQPVNPYNQSPPALFYDTATTFRLSMNSTSDHAALVVLRDPLFAASTVSVTY